MFLYVLTVYGHHFLSLCKVMLCLGKSKSSIVNEHARSVCVSPSTDWRLSMYGVPHLRPCSSKPMKEVLVVKCIRCINTRLLNTCIYIQIQMCQAYLSMLTPAHAVSSFYPHCDASLPAHTDVTD